MKWNAMVGKSTKIAKSAKGKIILVASLGNILLSYVFII